MRYVKDSTCITVQCFLQDFLGSNIQMIGRLVQDQKIGFGEHQLCKGNTASLSTGKRGNHLEYIIPCEQKGCQHIADLCFCKSRIGIGDFLEYCFFHMEYMMFLVIVTDLYLGTKGKLAGIGRNHLVQDLK